MAQVDSDRLAHTHTWLLQVLGVHWVVLASMRVQAHATFPSHRWVPTERKPNRHISSAGITLAFQLVDEVTLDLLPFTDVHRLHPALPNNASGDRNDLLEYVSLTSCCSLRSPTQAKTLEPPRTPLSSFPLPGDKTGNQNPHSQVSHVKQPEVTCTMQESGAECPNLTVLVAVAESPPHHLACTDRPHVTWETQLRVTTPPSMRSS